MYFLIKSHCFYCTIFSKKLYIILFNNLMKVLLIVIYFTYICYKNYDNKVKEISTKSGDRETYKKSKNGRRGDIN